jgi:DNA-binding MarR family transcriptional regulator
MAPRQTARTLKIDADERETVTTAVETSRLGILDDFIGFHLRLAQMAAHQAFARSVGHLDLKPVRFALLTLVAQNPGISQTALSQAHGNDRSTLTPALDDLDRRGLITRERVEHDRRNYSIRITELGRAHLRKLRPAADRHERSFNRIVGRNDRAKFIEILRRITTEMSNAPSRLK